MTRIFINGFGRIGRTLLRQLLTRPGMDDLELVAINDIAPLEMCAYLFRYDSVFGPFPAAVTHGPGVLTVGDRTIPFHTTRDLRTLDLGDVDVVLECTGAASNRPHAEAGLLAGAKAVLLSGPSEAADVTCVLGANEDMGEARIVSNASCTTNAIAPLLKALDEAFGIARAHVTTIHCYTGSQPTVDAPGPSFERSRAAAVSMIPTSTSAAGQVMKVLPGMKGRLSVTAVRVPVISVSAVDAVLQLGDMPPDMNAALGDLFAGSFLIGLTDDPCVSTDLRARPESLVLSTRETRVIDGQVRLFGWYDNEWGFSARMIDMARRMAARP